MKSISSILLISVVAGVLGCGSERKSEPVGSTKSALTGSQRILLTSVVASPTVAEMVSIYNPGTETLDLSNVYLADVDTYHTVTKAAPTTPSASDFIVRFPAGATIGAGETQTIAIGGATCFKTACGTSGFAGYGVDPTYEIATGDAAKDSATVPDMLPAFTGSIPTFSTSRGFTNGGEPVILFKWDGMSDLVTDIDYVAFGTPSSSNPVVNKTGLSVDGVDGDSTPTAYAADTVPTAQKTAPVSTGTFIGTCRVKLTEDGTTLTGGNGVDGRDETSEDFSTTWAACTTAPPSFGTDAGIDAADDTAAADAADAADDTGGIVVIDDAGDSAVTTEDAADSATTTEDAADSAVAVDSAPVDTGTAPVDSGTDSAMAADTRDSAVADTATAPDTEVADTELPDTAVPVVDTGVRDTGTATVDTGSDIAPPVTPEDGCSCRVGGEQSSNGTARLGVAALIALGAMARRRRKH